MTNILGLTNQEILMRARADLRLGIPIVLTRNGIDVVVAAIDVLRQSRLDQLKSIDENSFVLITARRAKTSKGKAFKTVGGVATGFKKSPKKFGVDTSSKYKRVKDYLFKDLPGTGTKKTKTKDLILGKTRFGRGARVAATQEKIRKFIGGAAKRAGGGSGVVGRRSAGGFTAS